MRRNLLRFAILFLVVVFVITGWGLLIWQGRQTAQVIATNGDLIRLHVLANSDDAFDQQLKLKVRDGVIAYLSPYLGEVASADDARSIIVVHKPNIISVAQEVVAKNGAPYVVQMQTGMFPFPMKSYGNLVLPAGKYEAIRILLGQAEGKNWWCVLFPPLCFVDGTQATATMAMTAQRASAKEGAPIVEYRWKIVEWWHSKSQ